MQDELEAAAAERRRRAAAAESAYRAAKGESVNKFKAAVQSNGAGETDASRKAKQADFDMEANERRKKAAEAYAAFRAAKVVADAKFKATVESESAKARPDHCRTPSPSALWPRARLSVSIAQTLSLCLLSVSQFSSTSRQLPLRALRPSSPSRLAPLRRSAGAFRRRWMPMPLRGDGRRHRPTTPSSPARCVFLRGSVDEQNTRTTQPNS